MQNSMVWFVSRHIVNVWVYVSSSHIEDVRYLCVVEKILFLVVFLELCCIVAPALLRCVCAGIGVLLDLHSRTDDRRETEEKMKGWGNGEKLRDAKTKCKVGDKGSGERGRQTRKVQGFVD